MSSHNNIIAVLGGGIQGYCIALELARRGFQVSLVEQDHQVMNRASLRNEGKIHLGLVYANDISLGTAKLQIKGALSFADLIERWTGVDAWELGLSTAFDYLVAKESFMNPDQLETHYDKLTGIYQATINQNSRINYLGDRPPGLVEPVTESYLNRYYAADCFKGGFKTAELAVSTEILAAKIRRAILNNDRIRLYANVKISSIAEANGSIKVSGICLGEDDFELVTEQVVNATWENRLALDASFGLDVGQGWVHRLKCRVIVQLPESLRNAPSATMVIGPFGDVVIRPNGTAYLSWYPEALRGWSHELAPPESWLDACRGTMDDGEAEDLAQRVSKAIETWYPGFGDLEVLAVDGGAIFAHGKSDVDNPTSGLHNRTNVGIVSFGKYHSVNPGKLTTAPLIALQAVDKITGSVAEDLDYLSAVFVN